MANRIADLPEEDRPREKLLQRGPLSLSDAELLAIFLRVGVRGQSAIDLGRSLLQDHGGSLYELVKRDYHELSQVKGIGPAKAAHLMAALELGRRLATHRAVSVKLDEPRRIYDLLSPEMTPLRHESLRVVLLDSRSHLIAVEEITKGILNESLAHPREILRSAIIHSAHSYVLAHNHPSGDPSPSQADRDLTRRLHRASEEVGISLLDHLILGKESDHHEPYFSFREYGLL